MCTSITSGLMGISSQIFIQTTCREPGVITWVQFLDGQPLKFDMAKIAPNPAQFLTTFDLIANVSGTDPQIENRKTTAPPTLGEKKLVNFGPQKVGELRSTNKKVIDMHIDPPKWTLFGSKTIFRPLRGDVPSNFYTRYRLQKTC